MMMCTTEEYHPFIFIGSKHEDDMSSPLGDSGRKDSLSLNVEFVKVNVSRSRRAADPNNLIDGHIKAQNIVRFSGKK